MGKKKIRHRWQTSHGDYAGFLLGGEEVDFISRVRKVVEEISKYEESLIYDVHYDTGYEDGKNEAVRIIRAAFPELTTLDEMLAEVTDENKHELEEE